MNIILVSFYFSRIGVDDLAQIAAALATVALAGLTFAYVRATREMVTEMREGRETMLRPRMLVSLLFRKVAFCLICVRNAGQETAFDVHVRFDPDILYQKTGRRLSELALFAHGKDFLPGEEYALFLADLRENRQLPSMTAVVQYADAAGKPYEHRYSLDPQVMTEVSQMIERDLTDLVNQVEDLTKEVQNLREKLVS